MPLLPTLVRRAVKPSLEGRKIVGGGVGRQPWQHLARPPVTPFDGPSILAKVDLSDLEPEFERTLAPPFARPVLSDSSPPADVASGLVAERPLAVGNSAGDAFWASLLPSNGAPVAGKGRITPSRRSKRTAKSPASRGGRASAKPRSATISAQSAPASTQQVDTNHP